MGKCTLTFEQMQLLNQMSDNDHRDNDWMIIIWAVNGEIRRKDTFQLQNDRNDWVLKSGDLIPRFESSITCDDLDFATATFSVVNLGSTDLRKQPDAANKIAEEIAQKVTEVYLEVAKNVLKSGVGAFVGGAPLEGLSELTAAAIEAFGGYVVEGVGLVFEKIIGPLLDDLVELYGLVIGKPYCNGDVLNDTAVFLPLQPHPELSVVKTYYGSEGTGCGAQAATYVQLTIERPMQLISGFASGPPPKIDATAALKQPLKTWVGDWAEDPSTPTPIIRCTITPSVLRGVQRAFKTLDISIVENVDPRFGAQFTAKVFKRSPVVAPQFPFAGNVFASLKPWYHSVKPGDLSVRLAAPAGNAPKPVPRGKAKGAVKKITSPSPVFKLNWQSETTNKVNFPAFGLGPVTGTGSAFTESADALLLSDEGVKLTLYVIKQGSTKVGFWVRYQRYATALFTEADVMLVRRATVQ